MSWGIYDKKGNRIGSVKKDNFGCGCGGCLTFFILMQIFGSLLWFCSPPKNEQRKPTNKSQIINIFEYKDRNTQPPIIAGG
ncbi:MAG: hypothetical protein KME59_14605 [Trichormus sp. ATA11-4-KO1]|jgi:hypothetical protein|nr:hypothetical protein [Trichormus sp. ATA11-4-KO1]